MKKLLLSTMALFVISANLSASNNDLFSLDEEKINLEMSDLNRLEEFVENNQNVSLSTVNQFKPTLTENLRYGQNGFATHNGFSIGDMEWGSFAWGFCCWPVGIFTVLLNDNKGSNHKISYFIGLGTTVILNGLSYGLGFYTF